MSGEDLKGQLTYSNAVCIQGCAVLLFVILIIMQLKDLSGPRQALLPDPRVILPLIWAIIYYLYC